MASKGDHHHSVPLSVLLSRETNGEKIEDPEILCGEANQSKKGEDFTLLKSECQRHVGDGVATYSVFGLFDGHNGTAAAIYTKENLLHNVVNAIPSDLNRDEWIAALPRALVAGFVKTDKDFLQKGKKSGTTVTFVIIEGWVISVASVGDSGCVFESAEGDVYCLSADHRLDTNAEERERVTASGGEVGRLNTGGGTEIGPLRCWPGGLCLSRSIGDRDVGEFIVPVPYVKQIKLSTAGGRLIIASDGVWDAISFQAAFDCCRGMPPEAAAAQIVKEAVQPKGIRDDTTCIVVDLFQAGKNQPSLPPSKKQGDNHNHSHNHNQNQNQNQNHNHNLNQNLNLNLNNPVKQGKKVFKSMFKKKSPESSSLAENEKDYAEPDVVEEMFEEGSAMISERLDTKYPLCNMFKLFMCAICQVEVKPGEGTSIHADSANGKTRPWDGPFLCQSCQEKKEAMEGKRPSGDRYHSDSD